MPRADVWIVRRRCKRGDTHAVRWIDPSTGKARHESCGRDRKLARDFASRKREEPRWGVNNDPIDVPWAAFAAAEVEQAEAEKSGNYVLMVRSTLGIFEMICQPRGPLVVDYAMVRRFIQLRLQGTKRCPRRSCFWSNSVDRSVCWRCGETLTGRVLPLTPTTVNKNLRVLKAAFNQARKLYRLPSNPLDGVSRLETQEKPIRALTLEEQRLILKVCPDLRAETFIYLVLTTGLRRRELCGIAWDDIDLDARRLIVNKTKAKGCQTVRLTEEAVLLLRRLRLTHAHPRVFVSDGGGDFYKAVQGLIEHLADAAGIPRFTCHDLRKTFGTDLARAGVNQRVATALIGHASMSTTARYYQAVDESMADDTIRRLPLVASRTA